MIEYWWPIEVGYYDNPNHNKLNLNDYCYKIQSKTESGGQGWISKETYNTSDGKFVPHKDKKFKKLNDWIMKQIDTYIEETKIVFKPKRIESWFNIYKKGDFQEMHLHHNSILSAVYFLKPNDKSSPLTFRPPFEDQRNVSKTEGISTNTTIRYDAVPGRLVVFRSYVPHCVGKLEDDEDRITLAYNYE